MQIIPLSSVPSQTLTVTLGSQSCQIAIYQKSTGLYLDLAVNNSPIVYGVICHDRTLLVRDAYLGFSGDLAFVDQQGLSDPTSSGLGSRYFLYYFEPSEVATLPR
jgi:hypothetical protein